MNKREILLTGSLLLILATSAVVASPADDLSGTWLGRMQIPNFGPYEVTIFLKKTDQNYVGTVNDTVGYVDKDTPLENIRLGEDSFYFEFKLTTSESVHVALSVKGEIMIGDVERNGNVVPAAFACLKLHVN